MLRWQFAVVHPLARFDRWVFIRQMGPKTCLTLTSFLFFCCADLFQSFGEVSKSIVATQGGVENGRSQGWGIVYFVLQTARDEAIVQVRVLFRNILVVSFLYLFA